MCAVLSQLLLVLDRSDIKTLSQTRSSHVAMIPAMHRSVINLPTIVLHQASIYQGL